MKSIYVNSIYSENGTTFGLAVVTDTIVKNMKIVFDENVNKYIAHLVSTNPTEDFYFFKRAFQYVLFFQYQSGLGFSMKFTDYENNLDAALDEYNALMGNDWQKSDRDKIMEIFQDIQQNKLDTAEFVIENEIVD